MPRLDLRQHRWAIAAALVFLAHATFYLYFFVDDEGITLVYARSLLEGRGLTYADVEGPTEGYSNFLHVIVMAVLLGLVGLGGLEPIWTFAAGSVLSLACGASLVALVWHTAARLGFPPLPRTVGAMLLAASGPLAVWSNSSLETVPFALAFMTLVAATLPDIRPVAAAIAAIVVILMRVDGALYVGIWMTVRFAAGNSAARPLLVRRVAPSVIAVAVVYAAARAWYFDSVLPLPLQTKVAHKLTGSAAAVVWTERGEYLPAFASHGGWPLLMGLAVAATVAVRAPRRHALVWSAGAAVAALAGYTATVGDWMFGFRFFVPLLAPLALLCACGLAIAEARQRWLARAAAVAAIAWAASGAGALSRALPGRSAEAVVLGGALAGS
jgi:hypothetical protein